MIQLIYGSTAAKKMNDDELFALLETSRRNNEQQNITGLLLYHDGSFLQVLEGDEDKVDQLLRKILKDDRHHGLMVFSRHPIEERQFGDWEMAFVHITEEDMAQVPGFSQYMNLKRLNTELFKDKPSRASAFIRAFMNSVK